MIDFWQSPQILTEAERQLREFAVLPTGWRYGQGGPISSEILAAALGFVRTLELHGFRKVRAFAAADGGVMLNAVHGEHLVEVVFEIDGTYSVVHEEGEVEHERVEHVSWTGARSAVRRAVRAIWSSYASSTPATTTQTFSVSRRSRTEIYMEACRSS